MTNKERFFSGEEFSFLHDSEPFAGYDYQYKFQKLVAIDGEKLEEVDIEISADGFTIKSWSNKGIIIEKYVRFYDLHFFGDPSVLKFEVYVVLDGEYNPPGADDNFSSAQGNMLRIWNCYKTMPQVGDLVKANSDKEFIVIAREFFVDDFETLNVYVTPSVLYYNLFSI